MRRGVGCGEWLAGSLLAILCHDSRSWRRGSRPNCARRLRFISPPVRRQSRRGERVKVPSSEGGANHTGPESCVAAREGRGEALTGEDAGRVLSHEIINPWARARGIRGADAVGGCGRQHRVRRQGQTYADPAGSKTPRTHRITSHGSREVSRPSAEKFSADRIGKSEDVRR